MRFGNFLSSLSTALDGSTHGVEGFQRWRYSNRANRSDSLEFEGLILRGLDGRKIAAANLSGPDIRENGYMCASGADYRPGKAAT